MFVVLAVAGLVELLQPLQLGDLLGESWRRRFAASSYPVLIGVVGVDLGQEVGDRLSGRTAFRTDEVGAFLGEAFVPLRRSSSPTS